MHERGQHIFTGWKELALTYCVLSRHRGNANFVINAVALENVRRTGRISERHIRVRPEQIERVARQAGRFVLRSPVKDMQRHVMADAPIGELGAGGTIDLHLPGHRREGFEIVLPLDRHPRQVVAAMDVAGSADA